MVGWDEIRRQRLLERNAAVVAGEVVKEKSLCEVWTSNSWFWRRAGALYIAREWRAALK